VLAKCQSISHRHRVLTADRGQAIRADAASIWWRPTEPLQRYDARTPCAPRLAAFVSFLTQASWRLAMLSSETEQPRRRGTASE